MPRIAWFMVPVFYPNQANLENEDAAVAAEIVVVAVWPADLS